MRFSYFVAIILIIIIVFTCTSSVDNSEVSNNNITPVSIRIDNSTSTFDDSKYIDNKINKFIERWALKGVSLAIAKNGRLVYAKGYGLADVENNQEVDPSNLFRFASVSKLITATAIMKLSEDERLSLSDKVFGKEGILNDSVYLDIKDKKYKKITIEHLLRHTAGFTSRVKDPIFRPLYVAQKMGVPAPADDESTIRYQLKHRLRYRPGTRVVYSNIGYVILSKVIEKVTHMDYETYVKNEILAPCGVYDMHIAHNFPDEKYDNEVCYYEQHGSQKISACDGTGNQVYKCNGGNNVRGLSGAGGWVGSAAELIKFTSCIDGDETKPDILSKESVRYMTKRVRGGLPIGWMKIDSKNNWWRTGTLAGSTVLLKKMSNGMSWVLVSNTSSWRGSKFPKAINGMMSRVIRKVKDWPEHDLFNYFSHKPVVISLDDEKSKDNHSS